MTMLRLALSAVLPGSWTAAATVYGYLDEIGSADQYGNPDGVSATQAYHTVAAAGVSLADAADLYVFEHQSFDDLLFGGTRLKAAAGLVTVTSWSQLYGVETGGGPGTWQSITANGAWNLIKDIAVSKLSSQAVTISNFVDVHLDVGTDPVVHTIDIKNAKRGSITAADTKQNLTIAYLSNEYGWSNTFDVEFGNGNNNVTMRPADQYAAAQVSTLEPMRFNTEPQKTLLDLTVGDGNNTIATLETSATIHLGNGNNQLWLTDGHNNVWLGAGSSTVYLYSHGDTKSGGPYATDVGTDTLHQAKGPATVFLFDNNAATMPQTTIEVTAPAAGEPRGSTGIAYGHYDANNTFQGGDWSHLTLDLNGFLAGSKVSVFAQPLNGYSILSVGNTAGQSQWVMYLTGGAPTLAELHIHFS